MVGLFHMYAWDHGGVVSYYVGLGPWWGCFICRLGTIHM